MLVARKTGERDYEAFDRERSIGRTYMFATGPNKGKWYWSMVYGFKDRRKTTSLHDSRDPKAEARSIPKQNYATSLLALLVSRDRQP